MKRNFSLCKEVTFTAIGAYIEDFITELVKSGVKSREINNSDGVLYIRIKRRDYRKAAEISQKHGVRIRVYKRHGFVFKLNKKKKYYGITVGVVIASFLTVFLQNFVWKINIHSINDYSDTLILNTLAENGISLGSYVGNIDANSTELQSKLEINGISWLKIEVNGSRVDVYLNEEKNVEFPKISRKTPCNVIAGKTGVIIDTEVYSGTLLYEKGSGVAEGKVIVSGVVNDGADNLIMTHANAKIIADFSETVEFRQDYKTIEKTINKTYIKEKELMLLGFVIPITEKAEKNNNQICEETIDNCYFLGYELPWKIKTNFYKEYDEIEVIRTNEDVNRILEQKLELYCKNFLSEFEILDISEKYEYDDKGITLTASIKLRGNIAVQQEIMMNNEN